MDTAFKILSDFDGVWTEVELEAQALHRHLVESCAERLGLEPRVVRDQLAELGHEVERRPDQFGWSPDGRISAFADEDPLCRFAGLCDLIARAREGLGRRYRDAIEARWPSVREFAEAGFQAAMARFRTEHPPSITTKARDQLHAVTSAGAEVVVVSNSDVGKLKAWFRAAGIDAGEGPGHALRIRGAAGKQVLGDDRSIEVGGRRVYVDRPHYRDIIEQERPQLVIGDIFSLDLSLPHAMRQAGHPAAPSTLVLRRHRHTPTWTLGAHASGAIDHVLDRFADLVPMIDPVPED